MGQTEPHRSIPSVLVIASDPNIETLVGELVAFAGYRPVYDVTSGAAGESVRRVRPEVTLVDTALDKIVVRACLNAADEVGSRPVLMSSTASDSELVEEARSEGCLYFPLPGGPKPLERVIELALDKEPKTRSARIEPDTNLPAGSVHPALCAALASIARSNTLRGEARAQIFESRLLRKQMRDSLEQTRRSLAALRAAVNDYSRQLRDAQVPEDEALRIVRDAVADCARQVGADAASGSILSDAEAWAREAYRAA